jgi:hypothetical protein
LAATNRLTATPARCEEVEIRLKRTPSTLRQLESRVEAKSLSWQGVAGNKRGEKGRGERGDVWWRGGGAARGRGAGPTLARIQWGFPIFFFPIIGFGAWRSPHTVQRRPVPAFGMKCVGHSQVMAGQVGIFQEEATTQPPQPPRCQLVQLSSYQHTFRSQRCVSITSK